METEAGAEDPAVQVAPAAEPVAPAARVVQAARAHHRRRATTSRASLPLRRPQWRGRAPRLPWGLRGSRLAAAPGGELEDGSARKRGPSAQGGRQKEFQSRTFFFYFFALLSLKHPWDNKMRPDENGGKDRRATFDDVGGHNVTTKTILGARVRQQVGVPHGAHHRLGSAQFASRTPSVFLFVFRKTWLSPMSNVPRVAPRPVVSPWLPRSLVVTL